jgi:arylsulfatase A-like enzyme
MSLCRLFLILLGLVVTRAVFAQRPPNVLVILADDQGWGDLSIHGNPDLSTPRIDGIARGGAILDRFFVCPVCSPTRAELFTGRYYTRTGVHGVSTGQERLNLDETTIAEVFRRAGYATGAFGKWHNGTQHPYHPNARGFDEFYGFCSGHWGHYFDAEMDHNGLIVQGKGFIVDDLAEHAMEFMEEHRERPFFCYFPANTPHSPMQVPDKFYAKFKDAEIRQRSTNPAGEDLQHTRAALAMCENLDWNVGRLLDKLEALQLANDTIVVYFSDNGPNGWRWNGGMKGKKGTLDEGGVRVPCFVRWPGKIPAGRCVSQISSSIDLLPTLSDLAGVPLQAGKPLDGRSLQPLLTAQNSATVKWLPRDLFSVSGGAKKPSVSVRSQTFRLDPAGALFDMEADPGQQRNVAADHPDELRRLSEASRQFIAELPPGFSGPDERPYTVGYADFTPLPARDGIPHGTVRRSAKAPNCSYFTHWTRIEDEVTWDVDVGKSGEYQVEVYYACAPQNVGVELECSFEGESVRGTVTTPNDPPLVGEEHDRAPRDSESYVKAFRPFLLGELKMMAGRGVLRLRAPKIPGAEAVEVRYLNLRRVGK